MRCLIVLVLLTGCAGELRRMPTPHIRDGDLATFRAVPESRRTAYAPVLYATDRQPTFDETGTVVGYNSERSREMAFGIVDVDLGPDVYDELVTISVDDDAGRPTIEIAGVTEVGTMPPTPMRLEWVDGQIVGDPQHVADYQASVTQLRALIDRSLVPDDDGRVYLYVHGFNNDFKWAAGVMGQVWHYAGRPGLPVMFSWPAGRGGVRGYSTDRESGEFAVFHLKLLLRALAGTESVKRIDLIGHSRGTDVLLSAVRELHLEERGGGRTAADTYKLGRLVLAAPDIDLEVFIQRFAAERMFELFERTTVYASGNDKAIRVASFLFGGFRRLGRVGPDAFTDGDRAAIGRVGTLDLIEVTNLSSRLGHSYFYDDPGVSSDLILNLVGGIDPGDARRPLTPVLPGFWRLDEGYLQAADED